MAQALPPVMNPTQTDPLAQLRDIHMPAPIEAWPPAIGWWLLAALGVISIAGVIAWLVRKWWHNRYRREAVRKLEALLQIYERDGDHRAYLRAYSELLKLTALTHYDRTQVASLTGEAWVKFLDQSAETDEFSMGAGQALVQANYEPEPAVNVYDLHELGRFWIQRHRDVALEDAA